jgi:hypothetical protein
MSLPVWIFVYSDGTIFAICDEHLKSLAYRVGVIEIINIQTKESFTTEQILGKD